MRMVTIGWTGAQQILLKGERRSLGRILIATLISLVVTHQSDAQEPDGNLILNPSFEMILHCPHKHDFQEIRDVVYWNTPTITTPDFYNICGFYKHCVLPYEGEGYAGGLYIEYLEGQLKCPLTAGHSYYFEMYVQPIIPCHSTVALGNVGACFTSEQVSKNRLRNTAIPGHLRPQIVSPPGVVIKDTVNWTKVSGNYVAQGGERYLIIGFFPNKGKFEFEYLQSHPRKGVRFHPKIGAGWTKGKRVGNITYYGPAYYAYDALKFIALDSLGNSDPLHCANILPPKADSVDYTLEERGGFEVLGKLKFKKGKSEPQKGADEDIRLLWAHWYNYPDMVMELNIHTDTMTTTQAEYALCEERGRTLVRLLRAWGVPKEYVRVLPKGSSQPLPLDYRKAMSFTNERVEYRLIERDGK
jgi:outer membrane protein OmpA-like peptidoglycan-associated protein